MGSQFSTPMTGAVDVSGRLFSSYTLLPLLFFGVPWWDLSLRRLQCLQMPPRKGGLGDLLSKPPITFKREFSRKFPKLNMNSSPMFGTN